MKLVAYFSATGTTKNMAKKVAAEVGGDLFEITPETLYTATPIADNNPQNNTSLRKLSKKKPLLPIKHMVPAKARMTEMISPVEGRLP